MRLHLDTDLGGDPDDACALAMLLGWPGVELTGITTTIDAEGWRAAYVAHLLRLAGRDEIPLAAGAAVSLSTRQRADPFIADERHWPLPLLPRPSPPGAALDLLHRSIEAGATIVAIGPGTNLALLEVMRPGTLARVPVVMMGGWLAPAAPGLPAWGPEMDFNVAWDPLAAEIVVAGAGELTLVPFAPTFQAPLRAADLPGLGAAGPLGDLLARHSAAYATDRDMAALGRAHTGLPDDLINLHYDPVTCAAAVGWSGVALTEQTLRPLRAGAALRFELDPMGRPIRVVTAVDGAAFTDAWLAAVEAAHR